MCTDAWNLSVGVQKSDVYWISKIFVYLKDKPSFDAKDSVPISAGDIILYYCSLL